MRPGGTEQGHAAWCFRRRAGSFHFSFAELFFFSPGRSLASVVRVPALCGGDNGARLLTGEPGWGQQTPGC